MVETATTVIEEHQVIENASSRRCGRSRTWFLVAPLIDIVCFAMCLEIRTVSIEIVANVSDVFFKEWQLRVGIPHICSNTQGILVAIGQACFLGLCSHSLSVTDMVETATTVVKKHQILENTRCGCRRGRGARFLVTPFINVVGLTMCLEIGTVSVKIVAYVCYVFF
jgi:hypothetical protein